MQFTDYLTPIWVNVMITLGVALAGGGLVCLGVYLGLQSGFDSVFGKKKEKKTIKKNNH